MEWFIVAAVQSVSEFSITVLLGVEGLIKDGKLILDQIKFVGESVLRWVTYVMGPLYTTEEDQFLIIFSI